MFEVGGADVVSYGRIMQEYARQRGLRRWLIPVPLLTPHLSSLWLGLTTPVYARVGRELVDGLRTATVVSDAAALNRVSRPPAGAAAGDCAGHRGRGRRFRLDLVVRGCVVGGDGPALGRRAHSAPG